MKIFKLILLPVFILVFSNGNAQVGDVFPNLEGESLSNKTVSIPKDVKGKYTIVGMAWSKKSEEDLQSWFSPVYDLFIAKNTFFPIDYDVNIYFIPMFSGVKQGAYKAVMKKAKKQIDVNLAPYVLFYKGSIADYQTKLSMSDKTIPYFFVLNKAGKIVYTTSGKFTEKKLDAMEAFISKG